MDALLDSIATLEWWQFVLALVVVIVGSSAASAIIAGIFERARHGKDFKRDRLQAALQAVGEAHRAYLKYGHAELTFESPARDREIARAASDVQVAIAASGRQKLLPDAEAFIQVGELYASKNEDTSHGDLQKSFSALVLKLAKMIPAR